MERQSKVLVVDDDPFALRSIAKVLEGGRYQVMTAINGSEALDLLRQDSFDLVLTDLKMPEVDGLEVLRQAREIAPQAVVLILTGYASVESAIEALREGAYDYLVKPYSADELRLKIERGLERVRLTEERQRAEEALRLERNLAESLAEAAAVVSSTLDPDQVLDLILEQVSRVVPNDATNIMLVEGDQVRIVRWRGYERFGTEEFVSTVVFRIPEVPNLQQMLESRKPMVIPDITTYPGWVSLPETEWLRSYAAAPIVVRGEVIGFLNVDSATPGFFTQARVEALRAFADHAAAAIENARLYEAAQQELAERQRAEEELQDSLEKLRKALGGIIRAMALAVEAKDPYTAGHQRRVANLACAIATEMGLSPEQIDGIRMAAAIHDLGKIGVPTEILIKPGPLSDIEYDLIKAHAQVGCDILDETIEFPWPVAQIVLQHHERMNGSGYPQGLSGDEIMLEARVLAVADVVEAMASRRPYRPPRGIDKALEEISQNRGILYDAEVVDACLKLFTEKGFEFE